MSLQALEMCTSLANEDRAGLVLIRFTSRLHQHALHPGDAAAAGSQQHTPTFYP